MILKCIGIFKIFISFFNLENFQFLYCLKSFVNGPQRSYSCWYLLTSFSKPFPLAMFSSLVKLNLLHAFQLHLIHYNSHFHIILLLQNTNSETISFIFIRSCWLLSVPKCHHFFPLLNFLLHPFILFLSLYSTNTELYILFVSL